MSKKQHFQDALEKLKEAEEKLNEMEWELESIRNYIEAELEEETLLDDDD